MDKETIMHVKLFSEEGEAPLSVTCIGKRHWEPGESIGFQISNVYAVLYVKSGKGIVTQGNIEEIPLDSGSLFTIFPRIRFRFSADAKKPLELCWILFQGSQCRKILESIGISLEHFVVPNISDDLIQPFYTECCLCNKELDSMAALGRLLLLFGQIGQRQPEQYKKYRNREDVVEKVVYFIQNYYFLPLDMDMICDYIKYSRSYLSRLFNNELGMTIPQYVNQVRIWHAKNLLEQTDLTIQEISVSVGFVDAFYFSKAFKKLAGISPNQYRKKYNMEIKRKEEGLFAFEDRPYPVRAFEFAAE